MIHGASEQSQASTKAYLDGHFYRADRHRTPSSAYAISTASLTRSCYDRLTGLHARFRARVSINAEPRTSAKSVSQCRFLDTQPHYAAALREDRMASGSR